MAFGSSPLYERAAAASEGLSSTVTSSISSYVRRRDSTYPTFTALARTAPFNSPFTKIAAASVAEGDKWDSRWSHDPPHTNSYYAQCMVGGALACGLTHAAVTPLDVTKCNMQVDPKKYNSLMSGLRILVAEEGAKGVWKGWLPTLIGYSMQGLFKFGLYEYFKDMYSTMAGEENSKKYKGVIYCLGSASAEFFADIALCPMEMVKVKVQTSPPGTWPIAFGPALAKMSANAAETRFPFGSVVPLWSRQIPYTVAKFYFFEKAVSLFYTHVFTEPRESYSKNAQLGITFLSGYAAGVVCAIVSHPADSIISQIGKAENQGKAISKIASEVGFRNLLTRGLSTRIIMIGTLTGLQWWIYDTFKTMAGLGTSGGK
ncbi:Mitochondrial phosphate carrier protein 3, mitochondrial [Gracilariopsis chorda]|uniref:Mitochondrial phosphate carrier protein 3, mitochondrial n=1 Tax=Gracilariopsis chorda TaxID=448386 RepID=A0A2V3IN95_9FLOR|nr:Mitochondrial phosphate carrier protein 3, mitochondrial [Gracilariopsis chorda]|eukprot:PXF43519.1 Mitochondrial phosphate carrier protein 3, mitochondrial [Gracilariopsis chorda]